MDPARAEERDLARDDDPATAAEDLHVARTPGRQPVDEVAEVLDVPALVGADRDALGVLLDGRSHDLLDAAVVPEVDDLDALACRIRRMIVMAAS